MNEHTFSDELQRQHTQSHSLGETHATQDIIRLQLYAFHHSKLSHLLPSPFGQQLQKWFHFFLFRELSNQFLKVNARTKWKRCHMYFVHFFPSSFSDMDVTVYKAFKDTSLSSWWVTMQHQHLMRYRLISFFWWSKKGEKYSCYKSTTTRPFL